MIAARIDCWTTVWSKRAALVLLGWFLSSAYHGTLSAEKAVKAVPILQAQTAVIPKLAAAAGCQEKRGDIAEGKTGAADTANGLLPCPDVAQVIRKAESAPAIPPLPK